MEENRKSDRKQWKAKAREVVKSHYGLLVALCIATSFFGTEMSYIKGHAENLYAIVTGQEINAGGEQLKANRRKTREKVLQDIIDDNLEAGNEKAAEQMEEYRKEGVTNSVTGRSRGIFAGLANTFSSGQLYLILFEGLHSVFHSHSAASAIIVLFVVLYYVAVWVFLKNMMSAIIRRMFLEARTYKSVPITHLLHFRLVHRWIRAALTLLRVYVQEALWWLTIIGGCIKRYSYYLVPFIAAENPDIKPGEAIRLSRRMMKGHKWECFVMEFSFIGWFLLGGLTFGIADALWTAPYKTAAMAEFYAARREAAKREGIEGSEKLNDTYLYEKAEEMQLRSVYEDVEAQKHFIDENRVVLHGIRAFFVKNFGLWIGRSEEKKDYDDVDRRRQQIVEDRAVIKGKIYPHRLNPLWNEKDNNVVRNIGYLRTYSIWAVILSFFVFSLVGWLWEVSLHIITDGVFVNRGVMHGPWLPIYGGGVVMIMLLLARWRRNPPVEALTIVVLCGFVEYFTSYFLEITKGMRWWDYTGYFLNLNGRICGEGLLVFALGGMAAVYLLLPILDNLWSRLNHKVLAVVSLVLVAAFMADMVYSHFVPNVGEGITDYTAYEEAAEGYEYTGFAS
ncbi:MAG: DUF975 family protein [Lachnospiraceae bacterium]|nr:DUF975 family protein [Lachnospiraceae bacterium]